MIHCLHHRDGGCDEHTNIVELDEEERMQLQELTGAGKARVRRVKRAQILLAAEQGHSDAMVGVGASTVYRTKRRFVEEGLEAALSEAPRAGASRKLTGREEALHAGGASALDAGVVGEEMVVRTGHEQDGASATGRAVGQAMAAQDVVHSLRRCNTWRGWKMCSTSTAKFPTRAVRWCASMRPRSNSSGETRIPWPAQPGKPARIDYEYRRHGTANLFVFLDAHQPWRQPETAHDFARCMHELVEEHYRDAETVRVVLDNLSAHKPAALYEVAPSVAREVLRRLEFHFVPKHASWLNMVEIEIGVLNQQCLDRRIPDRETLARGGALATSAQRPGRSGQVDV